jgi:8-oxo-dGTP pyrophosphatase MutT (NUDIX family)
MAKKPQWYYRQAGVLPIVARGADAKIVLITSRRRKQWIVPKGIIERRMTAHASALKEAFEEAGVTGEITSPEPIGSYMMYKWQGECTVRIYRMHVHEILDDWPEKTSRRRLVVHPEEALDMVANPALRDIIRTQFAWAFS